MTDVKVPEEMEQVGEYKFYVLEQWAGGNDWNRVLNTPSFESVTDAERWLATNKTRAVNVATLGSSDLFRIAFVRKETYFIKMFNISKKTGAMMNESTSKKDSGPYLVSNDKELP